MENEIPVDQAEGRFSVRTIFASEQLAPLKNHKARCRFCRRSSQMYLKGKDCPVVLRYEQQVKQWENDARVKTGLQPRSESIQMTNGRIDEITGAFLSRSTCSLPHQRRANLSQYDNRRDSVVSDRYYFGIYSTE